MPETQYEAVIGLEVHVQAETRSKMFTRAPRGFGEPPNTLTDPVVLGLPGALPVMNLEAIEKSIKVGIYCLSCGTGRSEYSKSTLFTIHNVNQICKNI